MRLTDRLNLPQKIVVVTALAAALAVVGLYVTRLGSGTTVASVGWYAYAPLTGSGAGEFWRQGLHGWERGLIWLGLVLLWALASVWLLRPARPVPSAT